MRFNKHLILVGTARSGTSWLSETIAGQYRYRLLFEPEHETKTPKGYLLCDQWIGSKEASPHAHAYLKRVFSNTVDCDWIGQNSNRKFKRHLWPFLPKKYIVKFVRANLSAKYMVDTFGIPVIHLLRSPYDVIYSQQQVKFPWLYDLSIFSSQPGLVAFIMSHFGYDISTYKTLTDLEVLCLRWCIENVLPLELFDSYTDAVEVLRYEDLFSDIEVFLNVCQRYGLSPVSNIHEVYKRPSSKTHPTAHTIAYDSGGRNTLWSDEELKQINGILDVFKTHLYKRIS